MKYLLALVLVLGAYQFYTTSYKSRSLAGSEALKSEPYVAVYGRNTCSVTNQTKAFLTERHIEFIYFNIDDKAVAAGLHQRMEHQGISTRHYNLPVVDFSGKLMVRPSQDAILTNTKT